MATLLTKVASRNKGFSPLLSFRTNSLLRVSAFVTLASKRIGLIIVNCSHVTRMIDTKMLLAVSLTAYQVCDEAAIVVCVNVPVNDPVLFFKAG